MKKKIMGLAALLIGINAISCNEPKEDYVEPSSYVKVNTEGYEVNPEDYEVITKKEALSRESFLRILVYHNNSWSFGYAISGETVGEHHNVLGTPVKSLDKVIDVIRDTFAETEVPKTIIFYTKGVGPMASNPYIKPANKEEMEYLAKNLKADEVAFGD